MHPWLLALIGGAIIGVAASIMLIASGRVAGISGMYAGLLFSSTRELYWRMSFFSGFIVTGFIIHLFYPNLFDNLTGRSTTLLAIGGFLVGAGTYVGGGCTSGHGVCGISRLSLRSIVATIVFMLFGILTASFFIKWMGEA